MGMKTKKPDKDLFFKIGLVLIACYFVYFSAVLINLYNIFHEYSDFAISVYGLYFNSHYPQIAHGLQLMEFDVHLSPDSLFLTFIYHFLPSPIILLITQLAFMCAAALVILYGVRDLTGNSFLAFALCLAFLINPGTLGLIVYDSHVEFLIPLFYVLTLYTYLKANLKGFAISSILLLGSADVTPFMALALGIGLVFYEFVYNKKQAVTKSNVSFAYALIVMSICAMLFYSLATSALESGYSSSYSNLPPVLKISNGAQKTIGPSISGFLGNPIKTLESNLALYISSYMAYFVYAILLVILGFGLGLLVDWPVAIIFATSWLGGLFVIGYPAFLEPLSEYFGYVIGPSVSAAILGLLIYRKKETYLSKIIRSLKLNAARTMEISVIALPVFLSIVGPAVYFFAFSVLTQYHSVSAGNLGQILFFASNSSQTVAYAQLDSAIAQIPQNSSLMVQYFVNAHVSNRQYVENIENLSYYPRPQYVLLDFNRNLSSNMCLFENCTSLNNFVDSGNYSLYFSNGTALVYKRIS
jgi:uncharacterized membrane protein